jgi:hypothetical protein
MLILGSVGRDLVGQFPQPLREVTQEIDLWDELFNPNRQQEFGGFSDDATAVEAAL